MKVNSMNSPIWPALEPLNESNRRLQSHVHPTDWKNPVPRDSYHLVVIGAGTAGLVTAAGAAGLGARVALIERDLMGGDCLNVGCIPSKALIGASRVAAAVRDADTFGVQLSQPAEINFASVMDRMRSKRAQISPLDSAARFRELGVDVYFGQGRFENQNSISVTGVNGVSTLLTFRKGVIATGARAAAPPIPGLESVRYLTNETLFSLTELPPRLGIIGSGPIGVEMAQAFARFGSDVVLFEREGRILPREDSDAAAVLQTQMEADGVRLMLNSQDITVAAGADGSIVVNTNRESKPQSHLVDQLLVAVGRAPNTDGLNLERVHVAYGRDGVQVNDFLQTTNRRIYAAGDICSQLKFTHAADFQARIVIQNALFAVGRFGRKRNSNLTIPWSTYTSPEVAQVGMTEEQARIAGIAIDSYIQPLAHVDRAILDGVDQGFVKVHTRRGSDRILGATIVAENAGDLISEISLAMTHGLGLAKIGSTIHPYPTQADAIRRLGDQYGRTRLTPVSQRILNLLRRLNVGR